MLIQGNIAESSRTFSIVSSPSSKTHLIKTIASALFVYRWSAMSTFVVLWTAVGWGMSVCVSVGRRDETSVPSCPQRLAVLIVLNLPDVSKTRTFTHTVTPDSGCSRQPRLSTFHHSPSAQRSPDRKSFPERAKGNGNSTRHFFFLPSKQQKPKTP